MCAADALPCWERVDHVVLLPPRPRPHRFPVDLVPQAHLEVVEKRVAMPRSADHARPHVERRLHAVLREDGSVGVVDGLLCLDDEAVEVEHDGSESTHALIIALPP